jgi:hypothetical protein
MNFWRYLRQCLVHILQTLEFISIPNLCFIAFCLSCCEMRPRGGEARAQAMIILMSSLVFIS